VAPERLTLGISGLTAAPIAAALREPEESTSAYSTHTHTHTHTLILTKKTLG